MDLTRVIIGSVMTEKSERLKNANTFTVHVRPDATKIDVKKALKKYYDVEVESIRVMRVRGKTRAVGQGKELEKRHPMKKMLVTLGKKSKALDLSSFNAK